jgi:GT2 family glycosyltransferase
MTKKEILIICVNYNTHQELHDYVNSLLVSHDLVKDDILLTILIADNSDEKIINNFSPQLNVHIIYTHSEDNVGYLGAVNYAVSINDINFTLYDFVIISNVDLKVEDDFFLSLKNIQVDKNIGWIAPSIFSVKEMKDRNPKILSRPTKQKILFTIILYAHPVVHNIYTRYVYRKRKIENHPDNKIIYAGHGSFMIFTRNFFKKVSDLKFPSFLFGEEIFFAELTRGANLHVVYNKSLKIIDSDHASTGKLKSKVCCRLNRDSLKMIISKFF